MIVMATTTRKYLAFDIETAKVVEDASDWKSHRPLGIACAATRLSDTDKTILWHGGKDRQHPKDRMSQEEAAALVDYLATQVENGYVSGNGPLAASPSPSRRWRF